MDDFPFLVVAPHLPVNVSWDPEWVMATIAVAQARWPVDPNRIYLTGLSLGGYGTWDTAALYLDTFAAIASISGRGKPGLTLYPDRDHDAWTETY
jgi:predicted peptidase